MPVNLFDIAVAEGTKRMNENYLTGLETSLLFAGSKATVSSLAV
jgi:hypothetical protein